MSDEPNKNQQNDGKSRLTDRQKQFIPELVTSATFTEACETGRLNRTTLHEWLKGPEFRAEVEGQREQLTEEAFARLSGGLDKAVGVLAKLLDDGDKRLSRFAAKDVLDYSLKHREQNNMLRRLEAIEEKMGWHRQGTPFNKTEFASFWLVRTRYLSLTGVWEGPFLWEFGRMETKWRQRVTV